MSNINSGISDYSQDINFTGLGQVYQAPASAEGKQDSGVSSIKKSEDAAMAMYLAPAMNFPVLVTPISGSDASFINAISLISKGESGVELFFQTAQLKMDSITSEVLDNWSKSAQKLSQEIKDYINSPAHKQAEEFRAREILNEQTKSVDTVSVINYFDHAIKLEKVDGASKISETSSTNEENKIMTVGIVAAVMIGGALAIGSFEMSVSPSGITSTPLSSSVEIVERLQPLFPNLLQDVLPTINLMVAPLIYFTSWDSSVGSVRNKEKANQAEMAKNFAKEVIQMVSNPAFIKIGFIEQMFANSNATGSYKDQKVALLKLILACTALSLLYSVDVGKVIGNKFWGMEPQEFQGILSGAIQIADPSDKKLSDSQRYQLTLIKLIKAQLEVLPAEEKMKILDAIFEYFSVQRSMMNMLDPSKVIGDVLNASSFDPLATQVENQAV